MIPRGKDEEEEDDGDDKEVGVLLCSSSLFVPRRRRREVDALLLAVLRMAEAAEGVAAAARSVLFRLFFFFRARSSSSAAMRFRELRLIRYPETEAVACAMFLSAVCGVGQGQSGVGAKGHADRGLGARVDQRMPGQQPANKACWRPPPA